MLIFAHLILNKSRNWPGQRFVTLYDIITARQVYIYTILLVTTSCLADYQTVDKFGFHSEKYDNQGFLTV